MMNAALHEHVHQLLAKGQLPTAQPHAVFAGYGKGESCDACGKQMPESTVVYEISVGTGADAKAFALHLACYEVWRVEREHRTEPRCRNGA
jgi:hypothetical protein